jgi:hypothetical protein
MEVLLTSTLITEPPAILYSLEERDLAGRNSLSDWNF